MIKSMGVIGAMLMLSACTSEKKVVEPENGDCEGADCPCLDVTCEEPDAPPPYNTLTFPGANVEVISVGSVVNLHGFQGKLLKNGSDLYYVHYKFAGAGGDCGTAISETEGPYTRYHLSLSIKSGGGAWVDEDITELVDPPAVPAQFRKPPGELMGLDALFDQGGNLNVVFPGGENGLMVCGASDLVWGVRSGANSWSFDGSAAITDSTVCCTECVNIDGGGNCQSGTDIGRWPAIARDGATITVAMSDTHNTTDNDGEFHGIEFYDGGSLTGVRTWARLGDYKAHAYVNGTAVIAATTTGHQGVKVIRKVANSGGVGDWEDDDIAIGHMVGEKIHMVNGPGGLLGLVYYSKELNSKSTEDVRYCESSDDAVSWTCEPVEHASLRVGGEPSLAYDSNGNPAISYHLCGSQGQCRATEDGVRFAVRTIDTDGKKTWWRWTAHNEKNGNSGNYSSLVFDGAVPVIAYQNQRTGNAELVRGRMP